MGRVVVVTDSSTCLPGPLIDSFGIRVLPISVHLPESEAGDAIGAQDDAWLRPEAIAELTSANHPFLTEYLAAIEEPGYDAAVVVTPAIEFAAMYRNAALAGELTTRPAAVVDSRTAAAGQALVVLAGAAAASAGAQLAEVVHVVEDASRRVEIVASLANLEPIRRSGPVSEDVLGRGGPGGLRSVFRMRAGTVEPLGSGAGPRETLDAIVAEFDRSTASGVERVAVFHAGAPDLAEALAARLGRVDFVSGFSIAMQIYTGDGVVGAAWLPVTGS